MMKRIVIHMIISTILLSISFLYAERSSFGEIAVRLVATNSITSKSLENNNIKMDTIEKSYNHGIKIADSISICNNSILGWKLMAESKNKGNLTNGNSKISYTIKINNDKKSLNRVSEILSTRTLGNINNAKFDLMMEIDKKEVNKKKSILNGSYRDTINLTLYSND